MTIKELRTKTGLSQSKFGQKFHIQTINISNWEQGVHKPPEYVLYMIEHILELEEKENSSDHTTGYWEHLFGDRYECPTCGNYVNYHIDEDDDSGLSLADDWHFCPNCGTHMLGIIECVSDDE